MCLWGRMSMFIILFKRKKNDFNAANPLSKSTCSFLFEWNHREMIKFKKKKKKKTKREREREEKKQWQPKKHHQPPTTHQKNQPKTINNKKKRERPKDSFFSFCQFVYVVFFIFQKQNFEREKRRKRWNGRNECDWRDDGISQHHHITHTHTPY